MIHHNYPVPNTFGFDVKAKTWAEFNNIEELQQLLYRFAPQELSRLWLVGSGSNLLFMGDYDGLVLHSGIRFISRIQQEEKADETTAYAIAGSGVLWDDFVAWTVEQGLYGAENLSLIPGEVGAAAVQNIGAYGVEVGDIIQHVITYDILEHQIRQFNVSECDYGYRSSIFKEPPYHNRYVVLAVIFRLSLTPCFRLDYGNLRSELPTEGYTLKEVREAVIRIRQAKLPDPAVLGSAGSFFKNPVIPRPQFEALQRDYPAIPHYDVDDPALVKVPAAWLIDQCGWKGYKANGAGVYQHQPLVLVNDGTARPDDVARLAEKIIQSIDEKFHIRISPEVNYVI